MNVEFAFRLMGGVVAAILGWQLAHEFAELAPGNYTSYLFVYTVAAASFGIAFLLTPYATTRPFQRVRRLIARASAGDIVAGGIGLLFGLVIAVLLALPLSFLPLYLGSFLPIVASCVLGYLGMVTTVTHRKELFALLGLPRAAGKPAEPELRVLVDTSAIIDGRIADVSRTGFIQGKMVVPRFVLEELQRIADSPDPLRRNRGRRGLDMLNKLQKESLVPIEVVESESDNGMEVDAKLVRLAKRYRCPIVTNDYNLNKVAGLQGVKVLNINELANAVKSVVLPGEEMVVRIIQEGKEYGQGVGYLDDGTMVVVENGRRYLNDTVEITVTRVLQTVAGRMIFATPRTSPPDGRG